MKTIEVLYEYIVWNKPAVVQEGTPSWAWSMLQATNKEDKAIQIYSSHKNEYPEDKCIITRQLIVKTEAVSNGED